MSRLVDDVSMPLPWARVLLAQLRQFVSGRRSSIEASQPLRCSSIVVYSLAYGLVRLRLEILSVRSQPNAKLHAKVLALRHQLRALERQVGRPPGTPATVS